MADKFKAKTIHVEKDYNNIILIDPNKVDVGITNSNPEGVEDRLVDHEDLVMYANLETKVIPRTKLANGDSFDVINTTIASFASGSGDVDLNFLKPKNKSNFDTSWTDEMTGKGSRKGEGANQKIEYSVDKEGKPQIRSRIDNYEDTQTLGITSITVKITPAGTPTVDINMVDVGGKALFQQGDHSMYSIFFNLPYPSFYLTLKGYYGKAVRFQLVLISFNASYDQKKGNFNISLKLTGKLNALLHDTTLGEMRHVTKMYPKTFTITKQQSSAGSSKTSITTTLGVQKLKEVYSEYNQKGLIGDDLWSLVEASPMTIEGLELKLSNFTESLNKKLKDDADFSIVNDVADYRDNLNNMDAVVYKTTIQKYLDLSKVFVIDGIVHIPYKTAISLVDRKIIKANIDQALLEYLEGKLKDNASFGEKGTKMVKDKSNKDVEVGGPIEIGNTNWKSKNMLDLIYKEVNLDQYLNGSNDESFWKPTYFARFGRLPTTEELDLFKVEQSSTGLLGIYEKDPTTNTFIKLPVPFFTFGQKNRIDSGVIENGSYIDIINQARKNLDAKETFAEGVLADTLSNWVANSADGLGFTPTIRNIFAILIANAETFYRMMDDVHDNAWAQRQKPERLNTILGTKTQNIEPQTTNSVGVGNNSNFIYPWPQYYEQETKNDRQLYVIKYVGDTGNLSYDIWPEVDFTEEFLSRTVQKEKDILTPLNVTNPVTTIKFVSPNAIEYPYDTQPYESLSTSSFLYELWERSYLNSHYGNIVRPGVYDNSLDQLYGEFEGENAKIGAEGDLLLPNFLKNNVNTYNDLLSEMNKSSKINKWKVFESDKFVTDYISDYITSPNVLYSVDTLNLGKTIDYSNKLSENVEKFLKDTKTNEPTFLNTYPFNDIKWLKDNLANGNAVGSVRDANDTTKTFSYDTTKKIVARLKTATEGENRLLVNGYFLQPNATKALVDPTTTTGALVLTRDALKDYYVNKTEKNLFTTETIHDIGNDYKGSLGTKIQATSLLNTPYFVNAFIEGDRLNVLKDKNPYVGLGYLFLNALPLITTKEKIKNINGDVTSDLDYLYATLTKFSSIHQVPYAWVLKYGSIWHRYKKYVETNVDILNNIWTDFDYKKNYAPDSSDATKEYEVQDINSNPKSVTLQTSITLPVFFPSIPAHVLDQITLGFYPKVVESVYRYFTKAPIFSSYTKSDVSDGLASKNVRCGINLEASIKVPLSGDPNNLNRTINVNNIYTYVSMDGNTDFATGSSGYLLLPSTGGLPINQTKFECINDENKLIEELFNNGSMYNGSVKSLWGASHFGYFKNTVKKPSFNEYLKIIDNTKSEQPSFSLANPESVYSKLDEITSIFTPELLDVFETKFLDFCSIDPTTTSLGLKGEVDITLNTKEKSLQKQLLSLFSVGSNVNISDESSAGLNLANDQLGLLDGKIKKFLDFECILKIGNPNGFDRVKFGVFSNSPDFIPKNVLNYPIYTNNLPPDITFTQIQVLRLNDSLYKSAWIELYKSVGDSQISGISLTNSASTVYSFFKDNSIVFTKESVSELAPLIKIYATKKNENPAYSKKMFESDITQLLIDQRKLQVSMVDKTLRYLTNNLPDTKSADVTRSVYSGNIVKLNQYSTFKSFNDRWVAGTDFKGQTYFENFLFQDRANVDIGNDLIISVDEIGESLKNNDNKTLMDLLSDIISNNQCIFFSMPSHINFYGIKSAITNNEPIPPDIPNSLFGTHLNVDYIDSSPKFLITYVGKPSENLATNDASFERFGNDAFDMREVQNPLNVSTSNVDTKKSNRVVGFNVDFGIMNQNMFSDITLNMDEKKNTAESFKIYEQLGATAAGDTVAQQTVSLYDIYRTRSYQCKVTSLGNAMIQPTMYFNLRYIPLFYGPYWVTEVNHTVSPGTFNTEFTGIRMPLYSLPTPDSFTVSINRQFKEKWKKEITNIRKPTAVTSTTAYINPVLKSLEKTQPTDCDTKVVANYKTIPFTAVSVTTITTSDLGNKIIALTSDKIMESLTYNFASISIYSQISISNNTITCQNHNLYDISTSIKHGGSLDALITSQVCKSFNGDSYPIAAFTGFDDSINFMLALYTPMVSLIKELYNFNTDAIILNDSAISGMATTNTVEMKQVRLAVSLYQIKLYSWDKQTFTSMTAPQIYDQFIADRPGIGDTSYKSYIDIFVRGVKKFNAETEVP